MKFKGILSLILALCMLLAVQSISVFANDTEEHENLVTLFATFNNFECAEMTSEDNENFVFSIALEAGSYQFTISENDSALSHPTTIKDTTAFISSSGLLLSDTIDARCTLLASGGNYTFEYNTENNLLKINKAGLNPPADSGESLTVKTKSQAITVNAEEKITYNIYLCADMAFEDIQTALNFDTSKLMLTNTTAEKCCPNLIETYFNTHIQGLVAVNSSNLQGYDFTEEMLLFTFEFTAAGTGEAYLDFIVQDMTILGDEDSYYFLSKEVTEGTVFREELINQTAVIPSTSTETTEPQTTEATVPSTTVSSDDEVTTASTEPSETITTSPSSPTSEFELGDVNRDGKLNIRDATLIQKYLAKLSDLDSEQLQLADYNTDSKVNIKDATQIQKKLANLI